MNLEMNLEEFKEYLEMKKVISQQDIDYKPNPQWYPNYLKSPIPQAKCTKFCSKILSDTKCNKGKSCTFAHRIEDWAPITCNFGIQCNRKTTNCCYIHPDESKELFAKRINQKLPPPPSAESDNNDEEEEIEVVINKPYVSIPKECEEMIKEALKNRGITDYTIRTF